MTELIRRDDAPKKVIASDNPATLDAALDYFDGNYNDRNLLRQAMKNRYAQYIDEKKASHDDDLLLETGEPANYGQKKVVRGTAAAEIDFGVYEIYLTRMLNKIVSALEIMGSSVYTYSDAGTDAEKDQQNKEELQRDIRAVEEVIGDYRERGGYDLALMRADQIAITVGCAVVRINWIDGEPEYEAIAPQSVVFHFADMINADGKDRVTHRKRIEDATAVVFQLEKDGETNRGRYEAWVGRSEQYEYGRRVIYYGDSLTGDIPALGAKNIIDEHVEGELAANPYTKLKRDAPDKYLYEYPITIIYGNAKGTDKELLPINGLSLYDDIKEMDIGNSRLLTYTLEHMAGLVAIEDPKNRGFPTTLSGMLALEQDQKAIRLDKGVSDCVDARNVLRGMRDDTAEANDVPAHLVSGQGRAPESGYALRLRLIPLKGALSKRHAANVASVKRLFELEKSSINSFDNTDSIPWTVGQHWMTGEMEIPETPDELYERMDYGEQKAIYDQIDICRELEGYATDDEALDHLKDRADRADKIKEAMAGTPEEPAVPGVPPIVPAVPPVPPAVPPEPPA